MKRSIILSALLGVVIALGAFAATTDEIIRLVFDSSNNAFRVTGAGGGGLITPDGFVVPCGGGQVALSNSATRFTPAIAWYNTNATEANTQIPMPSASNLRKLQVKLSVAPGAGTSYTITLRKNGVSTDVECTVSNTDTTCEDTTNTADFVAGDLTSMMVVPSGTPTAPLLACSLEGRLTS